MLCERQLPANSASFLAGFAASRNRMFFPVPTTASTFPSGEKARCVIEMKSELRSISWYLKVEVERTNNLELDVAA